MADAQKPLTPSAIKYLLTLLELCQKDAGARCMDIAEQLSVTKPSVHSMIENLCAAGLAEKKKYGTVFLTPEGRMQAERYAVCCSSCASMPSRRSLPGRLPPSSGRRARWAWRCFSCTT